MNVSHTNIELANAADLPEVASFYEKVGYSGGVCFNDRILVSRKEQTIVAAVRLCEEENTLVLRGMYVAEKLRGKGLGHLLLERASSEIGRAECWCVPYDHLTNFYSRADFILCDEAATPDFLLARLKKYTSNGQSVVVMMRPARNQRSERMK